MLGNPDIQGPHNVTLLGNKIAEDVEMLYRIDPVAGLFIYLVP